jgi:hypothetical protein
MAADIQSRCHLGLEANVPSNCVYLVCRQSTHDFLEDKSKLLCSICNRPFSSVEVKQKDQDMSIAKIYKELKPKPRNKFREVWPQSANE